MRAIPVLLLLLLALAACSDSTGAPGAVRALRLESVVEGLESPVHLTAPAGDGRLFVVEQEGRVRVVRDGRLLPEPFLDLAAQVGSGGERGLLGLAFHPDYARNGLLFVNYTDREGDTRVERYRVSDDPDRADPASRVPVLAVEQPASNHNGGQLLFGPDGMLYVPLGDGGGGGARARDLGTLLGKILRLDVDGGAPYRVPADNPFVGRPGARPEIWAYGVRNPWRVAFDRAEGLLYVADVGQRELEEVNVVPADSAGVDYGWDVMEGTRCYRDDRCDPDGLLLPLVEYGHEGGACSVTGGVVYRGAAIPELRGHYLYADYCAGWVRAFRWDGGRALEQRTLELPGVGRITSFGEDAAGEVYLVAHGGTVHRLEAE